jgi:hypothetical protein
MASYKWRFMVLLLFLIWEFGFSHCAIGGKGLKMAESLSCDLWICGGGCYTACVFGEWWRNRNAERDYGPVSEVGGRWSFFDGFVCREAEFLPRVGERSLVPKAFKTVFMLVAGLEAMYY